MLKCELCGFYYDNSELDEDGEHDCIKRNDKENQYFKTEEELMLFLLNGGTIRSHNIVDRRDKSSWIKLVNGNRVYIESGKSAMNCLLGLRYWVKAEV
jgi:hypothetical protein